MNKSGWFLLTAAFFFLVDFSLSPVKILFFTRLVYFTFLVFLFFILRRFNLDTILPPLVAGIGGILFFYGLLQKFLLFPLYLQKIKWEENFFSQALITRIRSGRIFSLFALPTLYAAICAVLIIFGLHYLMRASTIRKKIFWGIFIFLVLFNLILTQSFGGILMLAAGVILYFLFAGILKWKYLVPIAMILCFFAFIVIALRFTEARELEPIKLRLSNWAQCLRIIGTHPFWGTGLGNYESEISFYTLSSEAKSIYAHNFFLQFASEVGLVFTFAICLFLFLSRKKWKPYRELYREKNIYITVVFIMLFYNLIDIGIYFFSAGIILSLTLSQVYRLKFSQTEIKCARFITYAVILALLSILLGVGIVSDNFQKDADFLASQKQFPEAEILYKKSLSINPFHYKSLMGISYLYYNTGELSSSDKYMERALCMFRESPFGNYLQSKLEYAGKHFFRSFYYAALAFNKNKVNPEYRQWYEYLKSNLGSELKKRNQGSN